MKLSLFKRYWDIMKSEKKDKTHTQEDLKVYYSIFKDVEDDVFIEGVKKVLLECQYFPMIVELNEKIESAAKEIKLKKWQEIKSDQLDNQDLEFAKEFYKKFCETDEEYLEKIKKVEKLIGVTE